MGYTIKSKKMRKYRLLKKSFFLPLFEFHNFFKNSKNSNLIVKVAYANEKSKNKIL